MKKLKKIEKNRKKIEKMHVSRMKLFFFLKVNKGKIICQFVLK